MKTVRLGYAVPSGGEVNIPLKHMVITGQTQEAGKTTALEALIDRSQCTALTFITKRGEGAFTSALRVQPYLKTRGDWQYVAAILEASRGEKLKFERPWIIRVSKGADDLQVVHQNVKRALADPKVRGMSADIYLTLDAYLDVVVPEMQRVRWALTVGLNRGDINAMDLTHLSPELQHLVIQSSIDYVQQHCQDTLIVIPEAWKFLPQGRNTPVKGAAVAFIRQAAAMRNYLWLDSQDLGGIEKEVLRSVSVWLLGVQRETNEIKRTLDNIPAGTKKPNASALASLELGQFFACWKQEIVKTFVQATWCPADSARAIATGAMPMSHVAREHWNPKEPAPMAYDQEKADLIRQNEQLKHDVARLTASVEDLRQQMHSLTGTKEHVRMPDIINPEAAAAVAAAEFNKKRRKIELNHVVNEIEVQHTIETIRQDTSELSGRAAYAIAQGWFNEPKSAQQTAYEWDKRGWKHDYRNVDKVLQRLTEQGFLRIESERPTKYVSVAGMKIHIREAIR